MPPFGRSPSSGSGSFFDAGRLAYPTMRNNIFRR
jgi:hypothetical protein